MNPNFVYVLHAKKGDFSYSRVYLSFDRADRVAERAFKRGFQSTIFECEDKPREVVGVLNVRERGEK